MHNVLRSRQSSAALSPGSALTTSAQAALASRFRAAGWTIALGLPLSSKAPRLCRNSMVRFRSASMTATRGLSPVGSEIHPHHAALQPPARGDLARRDRAHPHLSAAVPGVLCLSARARESQSRGPDRANIGRETTNPDPVVIDGVDHDRRWTGSVVIGRRGAGTRAGQRIHRCAPASDPRSTAVRRIDALLHGN